MSTSFPFPTEIQPDSHVVDVDVDDGGTPLLEALNDPGSRAILAATGGTAMTANELSEACDLPLSTAYRKLERLEDAGLVAESIRLCRSGKHTSEYARDVEDVHLAIREDGGLEVTIGRTTAPEGAELDREA